MRGYSTIPPIQLAIPADRQSAKRHYGVHPYFTRRPHNVVRQYILRYSREGDTVIDPFGGSGVTPIEAFLENRIGIQNDINPLANFIALGIANLEKGEIAAYEEELVTLREKCGPTLTYLGECSTEDLERFTRKLRMPEDVLLPKTSDVRNYRELFAPRQIAALAFLRQAVGQVTDVHVKEGLLLAWSATLTKLNRTFLSAEGRAESRGGSSIFSIYRYKIAKDPIELSPWKTFEERVHNVISAKIEITKLIEIKRRTTGWFGQFETFSMDVEDLAKRFKEKADYIFTDPPYGGHISYLDLSTLWNGWLGQLPDAVARERELIVGGELAKTEEAYVQRLSDSVRACISMLKKGRWLSIVFQHWNTVYFDAILSSAAEAGADLRAAVPQVGDTIWSMHKKKGNESVLAGELILTFYKTGKPKRLEARSGTLDVAGTVSTILSGIKTHTMYGEDLFNQLILAAWKKKAVASLHISKDDFNDLIKRHGWLYDDQNHCWVREQFASALFSS